VDVPKTSSKQSPAWGLRSAGGKAAEAEIVEVLTLMEEAMQRLERRVSELARDSKEAIQRLEDKVSELARDSKEAIQRLEGRMSKVEDVQEASFPRNEMFHQKAAANADNPKHMRWQNGKPAAGMIRKAAMRTKRWSCMHLS
jgi:hypothetical protein